MKAAVLEDINKIVVKEVPLPKVKPGSILMRVHACGICGSDLRIMASGSPRVRLPAIMGHEIVGEVVDVGADVSRFKKGDRLAIGADVPCGNCDWCKKGKSNCCDTNYAMGYQFAGGYSEYCLLEPLVVKYGAIEIVPERITNEEATCMEPLACCINGMEKTGSPEGKTVLIIGAGQVGCLLAMLSKAMGALKVMLADVSKERLEAAWPAGADIYIQNTGKNLSDTIMKATNNKGVDVIFTACSVPEVQEQALELIATQGVINFFGGLPSNARPITLQSNHLHYKECTITGSHGSTPLQNAQAMRLIHSGKINVKDLVTHHMKLDDIGKAFQLRQDLKALRVIVFPG